jgi:preprotein translocase subunit SecG
MLEILETPITGLHVFAALVLILIILIQPGKSGGLTAALGGAGTQQVFGGRGAGNFLTRGTWILATTFFLTSVLLAYLSSSTDDSIKAKGGGKTHHSAPASKKPAKK